MSTPAKLDEFLEDQDVWAEKEDATAMGGVMACFVAYHWCSKACFRYGPQRPSPLVGKYLEIRRYVMSPFGVRGILIRYSAGRRFLNHIVLGARLDRWMIYLLYWATNCIMLFTNPCWELVSLTHLAKK